MTSHPHSQGSEHDRAIPLWTDDPGESDDRVRLAPLDFVTRLVFPLAFLLVTVAQLDPQSPWYWIGLGLAILSFGIGIYHPTIAGLRRWLAQRRDRRQAREAYPEFRRFVTRFGQFVDTDAKHDLEEIIRRELRRENVTTRDALGMARKRLFQGFWYHLDKRTRRRNPEFGEFLDAVSEFNHLVTRYLRETVAPVFDGMPDDVRSSLPARARQELEAFREKLIRFIEDYDEFKARLRDSLETSSFTDAYLSRPKPLTRPDE